MTHWPMVPRMPAKADGCAMAAIVKVLGPYWNNCFVVCLLLKRLNQPNTRRKRAENTQRLHTPWGIMYTLRGIQEQP